jgi:cholesterol 7-dehydrogenase
LLVDYFQDFSDVGYNHLFNEQRTKQTRKSRAEVARESRRKRVVGNIPPVFPNGWFAILDSDDIATEQVKHVSALGMIII